jgi:uncharacterized protein YozE (UPF0346 family)
MLLHARADNFCLRAGNGTIFWKTGMSSSFKNWLETQTERDDDLGRFARDVAQDSAAPGGVSMHVWLDHLQRNSAGPGATQAFHDAWSEYLQSTRYSVSFF